MSPDELQVLVEQISLTDFGAPFNHKASFNKRLRTTGGRYHLESHDLDFNLKVFETFGMEEFLGVIKHELCHYHLHLANKGFQHRDADFKLLLQQVGGSRYVKSLAKPKKTHFWIYECKECAQRYYRKRRMNTQKYCCGVCRGKLKLKPERLEQQV
ncbi:SprT family protein [Desemzia sp. FAM 24101]|uniref:SprT family protein n=1 Tax=unclassified Desemzia TaxID=2685243 RepID=UPI003884E1F7